MTDEQLLREALAALEHIKGYSCPVCLEEQPREICPYHIVIDKLEQRLLNE